MLSLFRVKGLEELPVFGIMDSSLNITGFKNRGIVCSRD